MKQVTLMEKYPIFTIEFEWSESKLKTLDSVCEYFEQKIKSNPKCAFIGIFDHYAHTKSIDGEIANNIIGAKNVVFCFGPKIPNPQVLAVRPRSIGICDLGDKFVIPFLEAPAQNINEIMENWTKEIK